MNPANELSKDNVIKIEILPMENIDDNDNDSSNILEQEPENQLDIDNTVNTTTTNKFDSEQINDNNIINYEEYNIPKNLSGRKKNQFLRMRGLEYIGGTNKCPKKIEARKLGDTCKSLQCAGSKIRHCNEFTEQQRQQIFRKFWYNMNWSQKKSYVREHVIVAEPSRRRIGTLKSRRQNTMKFYLNIKNKKYQVCKTMFSSTLSLGDTFVREWVQKPKSYLKNKKNICSANEETEKIDSYNEIDENIDFNDSTTNIELNNSKNTENIANLNVEIIKSKLPNIPSKFHSILSTNQKKEIGIRCKIKYCHNNKCLQIQNEQRNLIYNQFWFEMNESEKLIYIQKNIEVIRTGPIKPNIMDTYYYFLKITKRRYPVCKKMFLSTLGLIEKNVELICDDYKKMLMGNSNESIEDDDDEENDSDESKSDNDTDKIPTNIKTHNDPLDVNIEYIDVNVDVHMDDDEYSNPDLESKNIMEESENKIEEKGSSKFRDDNNDTDENSSMNDDTDQSSWKDDIKNDDIELNDNNSDNDSIPPEKSVVAIKKQKTSNINKNVYSTRSSSKKLLPIKKSNELGEEFNSNSNKNDNIIKRKTKQHRTTTTTAQQFYEELSNVQLSNGIIIPPEIGPTCKSTLCMKIPNRRCSEITEEQRIDIFKKFWCEMSLSDRKQYVKDNIEKYIELKILKYKYKLIISQEQFLVCKRMFMNTLCLHEICIRNWLNNIENYDFDLTNNTRRKSIETIRKDDKRMNENTMEKLQILDEFLDTLPKIPPKTFITQNPNKIYLNENIISTRNLYHMYTEQIKQDNIGYPLSQTFLTKRLLLKNLTFYRGKKLRKGKIDDDKQISDIEKVNLKRGQQEKYRDKALARKSSSTILINIDSLKVKMSPNIKYDVDDEQSDNSNTRLCCYNFTVCNILTLDSISYWFCETDASNTNNSSYITCLLDYFNNYCKIAQQIIIYSNLDDIRFKNLDMSNALLDYSIQMNKMVIQKFLPYNEKVESECDIIHTSISRKLKRFEIMLPSDYLTATVDARKEPCAAKWMSFRVFKDFSVQTKKHRYYKLESLDGKEMDNFIAILYKDSGEILYKYEFDDEWSIIKDNCKYSDPIKGIDWPQLYLERRKISAVKYQSLQSLKVQLPRDCHFFYDYLTIEI